MHEILLRECAVLLASPLPAFLGPCLPTQLLRVIDSLQLTANHSVATPVDWQPGQDVIIAPSVSNDEAKSKFTKGFKVRGWLLGYESHLSLCFSTP